MFVKKNGTTAIVGTSQRIGLLFVILGIGLAGCTGGTSTQANPDLSLYLFRETELPTGWRVMSNDNLSCKLPFWNDNPKLSDERDFVNGLCASLLERAIDPKIVRHALAVIYTGPEDKSGPPAPSVTVLALFLDSEGDARKAKGTLGEHLGDVAGLPTLVRQDGRVIAVMVYEAKQPNEVWEHFKKRFQSK